MTNRISKSTIDWAKLSTLFSRAEQSEYLKLKSKSDVALRKVSQNPAKPPEIDFNAIRAQLTDKSAVESLEKAYKSFSVKFPTDNNVGQLIANQEREHKEKGKKLVGRIRDETKEANELMKKFDDMIPVDQMHPEEFIYTFPDWASTPQSPMIDHKYVRQPGLSKREMKERYDSLE